MGDPRPPNPPILPDLLILNPSSPFIPPSAPCSSPDSLMREANQSPPPVIIVTRGSSFTKKGILGASPPASPSKASTQETNSALPTTKPSAKVGKATSAKSIPKSTASLSVPKDIGGDFNWAKSLKSTCKIKTSSVPVSYSSEGIPRVKIPNEVFERGAELHSDYIVGIFYGNPPSYGKIWGVLNYLWGKDKKVTIHNLTSNAFLFRIPSESLRKRVLQHELWRVGDSPFFVTEWKASYSLNPPSLQKAPIWTTIKNIPFDLITDVGPSLIARPLGEVVDAKPYTSVNSATIKIVVDLTKELLPTMEIERDDGQIVTLEVSYPWLPPLCSICKEIGHKENLCPQIPKSAENKDGASSSGLSAEEKAREGRGKEKAVKKQAVWSEIKMSKKSASKSDRTSKSSVPNPLIDRTSKSAVPEKVVSQERSLLCTESQIKLNTMPMSKASKLPVENSGESNLGSVGMYVNDERSIVLSGEKTISGEKGFKEVSRASPARKVPTPEKLYSGIVSKNAFAALSNDEDGLSDEGCQEIVIHNEALASPPTPFFLGSPRASRKKRKWMSKNSPISGGDLPLISGGCHQN
ncbi:unnamed protein product [Microthlaspi erraticum]|uniref:DUF4283 domain-containing protein n=1 Tax=Microthlaspi erraticum TaxID=1685480 RepID=A0A6D2KMN7_9BRAS|nr:unnamed protein product [Microthlaspi erraticum]